MKRILFILLTFFAAGCLSHEATAQNKISVEAGADFMSNYIWRGNKLGNFSWQPYVAISYGRFSFDAWGSTGFKDTELLELDLTLAYKHKGLKLSVSDFWFTLPGNGVKYFDYSATTPHVYQAEAAYDFGPFSLNWATIFAGNDGIRANGNRAYTSYMSAKVPFSVVGCSCVAEVGAALWDTTYMDNVDGFDVCDVSLQAFREFNIADIIRIPLLGKITYNPATDKYFFTIGLCL